MAKIISIWIKDQRQVIRNTHWNVLETRLIKSYVFPMKYGYTGSTNFEAAARAASETRRKKVKKGSGERKEVQLVLPGRFPMGEVGNSYNIFRRAGETKTLSLHALRWPGLGGRG
jgi:hypothetical protein